MPVQASRLNVFIGSAKESIPYAVEVTDQLGNVAQVTPWFNGTFGANDYTMESLEQQLEVNDFGVFIFSPDDVALIRGKYVFVTRDNTLFEMGLFWGKLGRRRVICIVPRDVDSRDDLIEGQVVKEYHLLSDLQGLTILQYDHTRTDNNKSAAVGVACRRIAELIQNTGRYPSPEKELKQKEHQLKRKQSILGFFSEYNRLTTVVDDTKKYHALAEAVRISFLALHEFRIVGAAMWQKQGNDCLAQVGGNVENSEKHEFGAYEEGEKPAVLEAFLTGEWSFFRIRKVAPLYILCYPLRNEHVLQVNIIGSQELTSAQLSQIVEVENEELLETIRDLVGGDSR